MSTTTDKVPFTTAVGQHWSGGVACPKCGVPADTNEKRRPKFSCPDERCVFRYGWRLIFGADMGRCSDVATTLFAVPFDETRTETLFQHARIWKPGLIQDNTTEEKKDAQRPDDRSS